MSANLESTRIEWERAYRDLEELTRDPIVGQRLQAQLGALSAELRRRIGGGYTLRELAEEYAHADRWAHHVLAEQGSTPGWARTLTLVEGAAFHLYARGAQDYAP